MFLLLIICAICFLSGIIISTQKNKLKADAAFKDYNNKTKDFFK